MTRVEPVRKRILVKARREVAFRVFTEKMDSWWPRSHHIGSSPLKRQVLEPKMGGRWYSEQEDGGECGIGKVLAWEPPARLLLAWQLTADWRYDPGFMTEVEVTFTVDGPKATWVELEHRNLERFAEAAEKVRSGIDSPEGWGHMLERFADVAAAEPEA